jgi:hypothetical protein
MLIDACNGSGTQLPPYITLRGINTSRRTHT